MKIISNIIRAIDNFINPKCSGCGQKLTDMSAPTPGMTPEPVYVCANLSCKKI